MKNKTIKIIISLILLLLIQFNSFSQKNCISGDCENGYGTGVYYQGAKYTGYWKNGKWEGKGKLKTQDIGTYEGEFQQGKFWGQGKLTALNGTIKEGQWINDEFQEDKLLNGYNTYTTKDGTKLEGNFVNGYLYGVGTITNSNGDKYVGAIVKSKKQGHGIFYGNSGVYAGWQVEGEFYDGNLIEGNEYTMNENGKVKIVYCRKGTFRDKYPEKTVSSNNSNVILTFNWDGYWSEPFNENFFRSTKQISRKFYISKGTEKYYTSGYAYIVYESETLFRFFIKVSG